MMSAGLAYGAAKHAAARMELAEDCWQPCATVRQMSRDERADFIERVYRHELEGRGTKGAQSFELVKVASQN